MSEMTFDLPPPISVNTVGADRSSRHRRLAAAAEGRMSLIEEIRVLKRRWQAAKPRSTQRTELSARLRLLLLKQLQTENRDDKRRAA